MEVHIAKNYITRPSITQSTNQIGVGILSKLVGKIFFQLYFAVQTYTQNIALHVQAQSESTLDGFNMVYNGFNIQSKGRPLKIRRCRFVVRLMWEYNYSDM